jgi:mono/diheme cytochrome c family protein
MCMTQNMFNLRRVWAFVCRGGSSPGNAPGNIGRLVQIVLVSIVVVLPLAFPRTAAADAVEAKKIFSQRCTACHSFGRGIKVGPDLKGVAARRQMPWLLKFIRSSQGVIKGGDPVAQNLFQQFKQQRMPDWTDLSEAQIYSIVNWLATPSSRRRSTSVTRAISSPGRPRSPSAAWPAAPATASRTKP